jgi:erythromycin esterase-like protein
MSRGALVLLLGFSLSCTSIGQGDADTAVQLAPHAHPVVGEKSDYDALLDAIGDASLVLLGESTHGTREFYLERARITRRLIEEKGFTAIALEADWSDAARVDRYVRGEGSDRSAEEALGGFKRFPRWMWRNREFADLVDWIRAHNTSLPSAPPRVGIYGIDLFGLGGSIDLVVSQLRQIDESAADDAEKRYRCFTPADREDPLSYGRAAAQRASRSCAEAASEQLEAVRVLRGQTLDEQKLDLLFAAEQNARVVRSSEEYFREQARGQVSAWNLRDRHMTATLAALQEELIRQGGSDRIVIWAHNSHIGDARATQRNEIGEWNLGQLVRQHWDRRRSFSVGLMTDTGEAIAATEWNGRAQVKALRPSIHGSHGAILHDIGLPAFYLILSRIEASVVNEPRLQRFIGVIYRPDDERRSHYVRARLREQFDAVIHLDRTTSLQPLD